MFVKLALLACTLAVATAVWNGPLAGGQPASLYPAGVSAAACPNFPNCANPAVAANPQQALNQGWNQPQNSWNSAPQHNQWNPAPQNQWNSAPQNQWNSAPQNQWNPSPVPQYSGNDQDRLNKGEYIGDGDYRGEGLAEALAPGYENQNNYNNYNNYNQGQGYQGVPAQAHGVGQIPAGVDARSCPNYPFCT